MKIERFKPHHLEELRDAVPFSATDEDVAALLDRGIAFTGFIEGRGVAIAGIYKLHGKVGQAWALFSPEALSQPIALTRAVAAGLLWATAELGRERVQLTVVDGHLAGHRFAKFLGFEVEGFMKKYGLNGEGHWMYARIA